MGSMNRSGIYLGIVAVVLLSICGPARGADSSGNYTCISAITPCSLYLNTTGRPPSACCSPLEIEYNTDKACLCGLWNDTALLNELNISITQATGLPVRCGLKTNANDCTNRASSTSKSAGILPLRALLLLGVVVQVYQHNRI